MIKAIFEFLFSCHHRNLSRVFTIRAKTYKVCTDCGAEFAYSLETMSMNSVSQPRHVRHWSPLPHGGTN